MERYLDNINMHKENSIILEISNILLYLSEIQEILLNSQSFPHREISNREMLNPGLILKLVNFTREYCIFLDQRCNYVTETQGCIFYLTDILLPSIHLLKIHCIFPYMPTLIPIDYLCIYVHALSTEMELQQISFQ